MLLSLDSFEKEKSILGRAMPDLTPWLWKGKLPGA
jgi:hypothetical protein